MTDKLYTLQTRASFEQVRELAVLIATRTGEPALIEEQRPTSSWTQSRLMTAIMVNASVALAAAPGNHLTWLGAYAVGWFLACIVLTFIP